MSLRNQVMTCTNLGWTIAGIYDSLATWSDATFGTPEERGPEGPLQHLAKEVVEVQEAPDDLEEYADCLMLLVDAARRAGYGLMELIDAWGRKLDICKAREWPVPVPGQPCEHIREGE